MVDPRQFRDALGHFATGVTIVTALDENDRPVGVTANSYNSVSLDPPLVLWSIARSARSFPAFTAAQAFAIHVLAHDQRETATRFAKSGEDKFSGLEWTRGYAGLPVLPGCAARFECELANSFDGGDHVILVGKVVNFDTSGGAPLLFHQGRFGKLSGYALPEAGTDADPSFREDFLYYLLAHAQMLFAYRVRNYAKSLDASDIDVSIMGMLSLARGIRLSELQARLNYTGQMPDGNNVQRLVDRNWVKESPDGLLSLTETGRSILLNILAQIRGWEDDLMVGIDQDQAQVFKVILGHFIKKLGNPP